LVNALARVHQVTIQLQILRDNVTDRFNDIYEEVNRLGGVLNVEENTSMPEFVSLKEIAKTFHFKVLKHFIEEQFLYLT
jgi:hypothetical protein